MACKIDLKTGELMTLLHTSSRYTPTTLFSGGGGITIPCAWYLPSNFSWRPRKSL